MFRKKTEEVAGDVLHLWGQGESIAQIHREVGLSKATIRRILALSEGYNGEGGDEELRRDIMARARLEQVKAAADYKTSRRTRTAAVLLLVERGHKKASIGRKTGLSHARIGQLAGGDCPPSARFRVFDLCDEDLLNIVRGE